MDFEDLKSQQLDLELNVMVHQCNRINMVRSMSSAETGKLSEQYGSEQPAETREEEERSKWREGR